MHKKLFSCDMKKMYLFHKILFLSYICPNSFNNCEMSFFSKKNGMKSGHFSGQEYKKHILYATINDDLGWAYALLTVC